MKDIKLLKPARKPRLLGSGPTLVAVPPLLLDPAPIPEAAAFAAKVLRREMKKLRRGNAPNSDDLRSALATVHCVNAAIAGVVRGGARDGDA